MGTPKEMPAETPPRVAVVGASAGGVEALMTLVRRLPDDLAIPVCVVLHVPSFGTSVLADILGRAGPLRAQAVLERSPLQRGYVYVAPPDCHIVVSDGTIRPNRGPRENGHRPAIDPLFRSAATAWGPGAVGVVLSGTLDDGTAGLAAIKRAGGIAIVQDPEEALYPGMPESAIANVAVDHVLRVAGIADFLTRLDDQPVPPARGAITMTENGEGPAEAEVGAWREGEPTAASGFTCPSCGGALWEAERDGVLQFRCHVGHVYSQESMLAIQGSDTEDALWAAHSLLEARAALLNRLALRMREKGANRMGETYESQAGELRAQSDAVRRVAKTFAPSEPLSESAA